MFFQSLLLFALNRFHASVTGEGGETDRYWKGTIKKKILDKFEYGLLPSELDSNYSLLKADQLFPLIKVDNPYILFLKFSYFFRISRLSVE